MNSDVNGLGDKKRKKEIQQVCFRGTAIKTNSLNKIEVVAAGTPIESSAVPSANKALI